MVNGNGSNGNLTAKILGSSHPIPKRPADFLRFLKYYFGFAAGLNTH